MKCECTFKVEKDDKLYRALLPDVSSTKRANWDVKKKGEFLKINFKAKDVIALKGFVNSTLKLLEMHEKIKKL